jgi:hypothetical protein
MENNFLSLEGSLNLCKTFFNVYYPLRYLATGSNKKYYLTNNIIKVCRFCNKKDPEVTFFNNAHTIPKFLGNRDNLSNFECDNCNKIFSLYEKHLSSYVGIDKTIAYYLDDKLHRKNPKFEHNDGSLKIKRDKKIIIVDKLAEKEFLIDDENNKTLKLKYDIEFIPINVFKSLVKIALCLLNCDEIKLFEVTKNFLLDSSLNNNYRIKSFSFLLKYFTPNEYFEFPTAYLLKKYSNNKNVCCPEFTMILFHHQSVFQIFIPLNINDKEIFNICEEINFPIYPPVMIYPNGERVYTVFKESQYLGYEYLFGDKMIKKEGNELEIKYKQKYKDIPDNLRMNLE